MSRNEKLIEMFQSLAQYQIDAIFIIAQDMASVAGQDIRNKLSEIETEYEENIKTISNMLVQQGDKAPEHTRDFKMRIRAKQAFLTGSFHCNQYWQ